MGLDQIIGVLWRRRLTFLVTALACIAAVVAVTLSLPKTYRATASLLVGTPQSNFATTDLLNQITRTYATLASNPHVADVVVSRLPFSTTRDSLMNAISVVPVESTQLIEVSAEAHSSTRAQRLANAYAQAFVDEANAGLVGSRTLTSVRVVEPAVRPTSPVRPNPPLYIGIGTLLALILATGAALLRDRLDRRIRVAAEDEAILGHPIIARIPRFARGEVAADAAHDRFALLKTNLDFLDEREARVVVVTSPGVADGKSTVAMHFAAACAADGERVVVVEGDLRRPGLRAAANVDQTREWAAGLSDYLAGASPEYDILVSEVAWPEITFIWSGGTAPNPVALLRSARLESLLDYLRLEFDRVVIDTPPVSVGADASLLVSRGDAVLYIINEPKTTTAEAQSAINQLEKARPRQLGIVLNRTKAAGRDSSYYYRRSGTAGPGRARGAVRSRTKA
jgi:capsular exopolysaccharide synthesis family protein